jgi:ATP-dependent RNA helicase DDX5/DBP2
MMRATKSSIKILGLAFRPTKNAAFYFSSQATMNAAIPSEKENILVISPEEFRKINHIKLEGSGSSEYEPIVSFDAAPFASKLKNALRKQGYTQPTATQSQSWSIALAKRDIISIARTGSGKTCGFLVPAIHALLSKSTTDTNMKKTSYKFRKPSILILAPTRELAVQIENEAYKIGSLCGVNSIA